MRLRPSLSPSLSLKLSLKVLLDGEVAFSKLERGHMPSADDIVAGLEKLGLAKAA